jgi:very-short-patch-repair endonuclease
LKNYNYYLNLDNLNNTIRVKYYNMENWKYEHLVKQIHRTRYKRHESFIIGSLLHDSNLKDLLPLTQHYVKRIDNKYALIDLFYPQINLAIEIDEPHHENIRGSDTLRQMDIEQSLICDFVRISILNGNVIDQIRNLKLKINSLIERNKNHWKEWKEPQLMSLNEMKLNCQHTMFVKIKGFIKPEELMQRQTGYWFIANNKRVKIKQAVVVHDSVIARVFSIQSWVSAGKKVGYIGSEVSQHQLLGHIVTDWNYQQTVVYSNDLY